MLITNFILDTYIVLTFIIYNKILLKFKLSRKEWLIGTIVISILVNQSYRVDKLFAGITLVVLLNVFITYKNKKLPFNILSTVVIMILSIFINNTVYSLLMALFNYLKVPLDNFYYGQLFIALGIFVGSVIVFIPVIYLSKFFDKNSKLLNAFAESSYKNMIVLYTCSVFLFIYILELKIDVEWFIDNGLVTRMAFFILTLLSLGIVGLLLLTSYKEHYKNLKEVELKQLTEYTEKIEVLYKNIRKFKHDHVNILSSMIGFMESNDMDGLVAHFENVITPYTNRLQNEAYNLGFLPNIKISELKGVISSKIFRAHEVALNVNLEILEVIERIDVQILDLCRIIGILLDNAIEAAEESEERNIDIALIKVQSVVTIIISNSYNQSNFVPLHKIYNEGESSKGINRGYGLSVYKEIIDMYPNILNETIVDDHYFTQIIRVKEIDA